MPPVRRGAYVEPHIDDSTADFFSTILSRAARRTSKLKADRANSALDHRHRFTLALIYDLPYSRHGNWIEKNLVGNWQFVTHLYLRRAQWMTVQSATMPWKWRQRGRPGDL